jgi:hypothetical protein
MALLVGEYDIRLGYWKGHNAFEQLLTKQLGIPT